MQLHYGVMSGNSARAVFCLFESKAEWQPRFVDTQGGENRRPEYLALNPMGKVPSFIEAVFTFGSPMRSMGTSPRNTRSRTSLLRRPRGVRPFSAGFTFRQGT